MSASVDSMQLGIKYRQENRTPNKAQVRGGGLDVVWRFRTNQYFYWTTINNYIAFFIDD